MSGKMLLIAEKPKQARAWATALGGMEGVYNGQAYIIRHALGHLFEMKPLEDMVPADKAAAYKAWNVANMPWDERDFAWGLQRRGGVADVCKSLKAAAQECDAIVFAGDNDPSGEGDGISYEAIKGLHLHAPKYYRAYFEDESPASMRKAFENLVDIPDIDAHPPVRKALFRSHWDLIGGFQYTRMATVLAGQRGKVLRNGRLKSSMIVLVGEQLKAVEAYVRKPFFQNRFKDENDVIYVNPDEPTFDEKSKVPADAYRASAVVCDSKQMKATVPPKLINLSTLSARLAPKGLKAEVVLDIYQKLYEANIVSYPRTDDKYITIEQFNDLLPKVDAIAEVVGVNPALVSHRAPRKTHIKDGMSHGANRPGSVVPTSLEALDAKFGHGAGMIYEVLAKSYLAMLCPDYEYEQQKGHVKDYPAFKGLANVPKHLGWKAVYVEDEDEADDSSAGLGTMADPFIYEGANPKPQWPTATWLMKQLEKHDIGTGATRTSTYAEITKSSAKSQIFEDKRGKIHFAECGEMSYYMLRGTHIADLGVTKHVQDEMELVATGAKSEEECLHEIQAWVAEDIEVMRANAAEMQAALGLSASHPAVGRIECVWQGQQASYYGAAFGHVFTAAENAALQAGQVIEISGCKSKAGNEFSCKGALSIDPKYGLTFVPQFEEDPSKASGVYTGRGKRKGQTVRFKRTVSGHTFTDEEVEALLAGKVLEFEAVSRAGNPYIAKGKLADQKWNGKSFFGVKLIFD